MEWERYTKNGPILSQRKILKPTIKCPVPHCTDSIKKENLIAFERPQEENDPMTKIVSKNSLESNIAIQKKRKRETKKQLSMLEDLLEEHMPERADLHPTKKRTLVDNVNSSEIKNLKQISLKTLEVESTLRDKVLSNFWTKYTKTKSKESWLPTETDLVDLDLNCLNGSLNNTMSNSWFSTNLKVSQSKNKEVSNSKKIYYRSLHTSSQNITDQGPIKTKSFMTKKIKLLPNELQRKILRKWFGAARYTYNKAIEDLRKGNKFHLQDLRNKYVSKSAIESNGTEWLLESPYEVRGNVLRELQASLKGNFTKISKGDIDKFELKYRSRKAIQEAIYVKSKCYKNGIIYPRFFGKTILKSTEKLPETLSSDAKLVKDSLNNYYLCISVPKCKLEFNDENQVPKDQVAALDPGVRTFQTIYDPSGICIDVAPKDISRIYRQCLFVDILQSKLADKNINSRLL
jgi:hypothetical protein